MIINLKSLDIHLKTDYEYAKLSNKLLNLCGMHTLQGTDCEKRTSNSEMSTILLTFHCKFSFGFLIITFD